MTSREVAGDILREARAIRAAIESGDLSGLVSEPFNRPEVDLQVDRTLLEHVLAEVEETIDLVAEARDRAAAELDAARTRRVAGRAYHQHHQAS